MGNHPLFSIRSMDGTSVDCSFLENSCSGTFPSAVWIVGGGPSLLNEPCAEIQASPAPKFAMNLAGRGSDGQPPLIRPNYWTTYDPTYKFHRSIFLDAGIDKFVLSGRARDLIPGGSEKLCDCPRVFCVEKENRGYADFLGPQYRHVVNCRDSFIQAINIAYHLGFRVFYCVGVDMIIRPSDAQIELALNAGVQYDRERSLTTLALDPKHPHRMTQSDMLRHFLQEYHRLSRLPDRKDSLASLENAGREKQYSFDVQKSFSDACNCDAHMWERVQYLRQARRNLSVCGVQIFSCTAGSRLNDYFPYLPASEALRRIEEQNGRPVDEITRGQYETSAKNPSLPYHKDVQPQGWSQTAIKRALPIEVEGEEKAAEQKPAVGAGLLPPAAPSKNETRLQIAEKLQEIQGLRDNKVDEGE